ncbi:MAG: hypothetical protein JXB29_08940 [Sedimentisphaerales bacterium]|nr:hypothetical protein [Sedimentisphaerales bacterium]
MVVAIGKNSKLIERVAQLYQSVEREICNNVPLAEHCSKCGRCCNFKTFGHYLFVTPPEILYLIAKIGEKNINPVHNGICPYNIDGKCCIYEHRFASCRIFFCKADADFQSRLTESALKELKSICLRFQIPYSYFDLEAALNKFSG